jgi:hypothetical protein
MPEHTKIHFHGGEHLAVAGDVETVAVAMSQSGPVSLTTLQSSVVVVNWSNVLYLEPVPEISEPADFMAGEPGPSKWSQ